MSKKLKKITTAPKEFTNSNSSARKGRLKESFQPLLNVDQISVCNPSAVSNKHHSA